MCLVNDAARLALGRGAPVGGGKMMTGGGVSLVCKLVCKSLVRESLAAGLGWCAAGLNGAARGAAGVGDGSAPNRARCIRRVASSSLPTPVSWVALNMAWLNDLGARLDGIWVPIAAIAALQHRIRLFDNKRCKTQSIVFQHCFLTVLSQFMYKRVPTNLV